MKQLRERDIEYGAWAWVVHSQFQETIVTYQCKKHTATSEPRNTKVMEALAAIDAIAKECKNHGLDGATLKKGSKGALKLLRKCVNSTDANL